MRSASRGSSVKRREVFVRPFPDVQSGRWQISSGGGAQPVWAMGGKELYYVSSDSNVQRVEVTLAPSFAAGTPQTVTKTPIFAPLLPRTYDVTSDGARLLVIEDIGGGASQAVPITIVTGWSEEVKRLLPVKR